MDMKKLIGIMIACMAIGCQKAELVESSDPDNGRNAMEEQKDTVDVEVYPEDWEGSIDVGFGF